MNQLKQYNDGTWNTDEVLGFCYPTSDVFVDTLLFKEEGITLIWQHKDENGEWLVDIFDKNNNFIKQWPDSDVGNYIMHLTTLGMI